jgi:hypothetical protein
VLGAVLTIIVACGVILAAYYLLPFNHLSDSRNVLRLGAVAALVAAVAVWQIRRISLAALPELRAVEALGIIVAVFLVGFSIIYLSMSHNPRTDTARLVVAAQMLLDLAIIGAVVRLIFNAARSRVAGGAGGAGQVVPPAS